VTQSNTSWVAIYVFPNGVRSTAFLLRKSIFQTARFRHPLKRILEAVDESSGVQGLVIGPSSETIHNSRREQMQQRPRAEDLRRYQVHQTETGVQPPTMNGAQGQELIGIGAPSGAPRRSHTPNRIR
jgi:hypothetical protein